MGGYWLQPCKIVCVCVGGVGGGGYLQYQIRIRSVAISASWYALVMQILVVYFLIIQF
jgi:hypothetical protein